MSPPFYFQDVLTEKSSCLCDVPNGDLPLRFQFVYAYAGPRGHINRNGKLHFLFRARSELVLNVARMSHGAILVTSFSRVTVDLPMGIWSVNLKPNGPSRSFMHSYSSFTIDSISLAKLRVSYTDVTQCL